MATPKDISPHSDVSITFATAAFKIVAQRTEILPSLEEEEPSSTFKATSRANKDRLYKPLLRKFRTFFRSLIDKVKLSKGCYTWSAEKMQQQVWTFMHLLELPECFKDTKSLSCMMILLFPTIVKNKKNTDFSIVDLD